LRGEGEHAGRALLVNLFLADFDGPLFRLGLPTLPEFRPHDPAGAHGVVVDACLQPVPGIRMHVEGDRFLHAFMIAGHLEDAAVAGHRDQVTLVHEPDGRHHAPRAIGHHVGLEGVFFHLGLSDEIHRPLKQDHIEAVGGDFAPVFLEHVPLHSRAQPGQGRETHVLTRGSFLVQRK
jgi:hypothetical protein